MMPAMAIQAAGFGAGAFDPVSLFAGGVNGVLLLPDVSSSVWQDASATTPAGNGDPIGRLSDLSGNGNHATQSTATKRPMYASGGGLYSSEGDATDDVLATTAGGGASSAFLCVMAMRVDSVPGSRYFLYARGGGNAGFQAQVYTSSAIRLQCYQSAGPVIVTTATNSVVPGQPFIATIWYDGANSHAQVNSQTVFDSSAFTLVAGNPELYIGAATPSGAQGIDGGIFGMIYLKDVNVSATDREACKAYLAARAGVTL